VSPQPLRLLARGDPDRGPLRPHPTCGGLARKARGRLLPTEGSPPTHPTNYERHLDGPRLGSRVRARALRMTPPAVYHPQRCQHASGAKRTLLSSRRFVTGKRVPPVPSIGYAQNALRKSETASTPPQRSGPPIWRRAASRNSRSSGGLDTSPRHPQLVAASEWAEEHGELLRCTRG
jgi:hypothetical protein